MKYNWAIMTDDEKLRAVEREMELETHNGTTKEDFVEIMKFLHAKLAVADKALELACTGLADNDCPYEYSWSVPE